jgi:Rrf2 family protein
MRLSPAAELSIRGTLVLAEEYGQGPVSLDNICARRALPKQYLVKLFASLTRAGLISPVRGKHGGYLLMREPGQISVLEVIEAVEGPIVLNYCMHDPPQCDREGCPMRGVWGELQDTIRQKLASMTLAGCLQRNAQPHGG